MQENSKLTPLSVILSIFILVQYTLFNFFISILSASGSETEMDMVLMAIISLLAIILAVVALIFIVHAVTGDLSEGKINLIKYITDIVLLMFLVELFYIVIRLILNE